MFSWLLKNFLGEASLTDIHIWVWAVEMIVSNSFCRKSILIFNRISYFIQKFDMDMVEVIIKHTVIFNDFAPSNIDIFPFTCN